MRICIITPEFVTENTFSGGIAQQFKKIASWEVKNGHQVDLITLSDKNQSLTYHGIQIHRLKIPQTVLVNLLNKLTLGKLHNLLRCLIFSLLSYRKAKKLHRQKNFDIIHSVNFQAPGLISLIFLKVPHALFVASHRPTWNHFLQVKPSLDVKACELLELLYFRLAKNLFSPSLTLKKILEKKAKIKNVHLIRTPFSIEKTKLDRSILEKKLKGKQYLLFLGRLQMHKGVLILAKALPQALSKKKRLFMVFVGGDRPSKFGPSMKKYIKNICQAFSERLIFIDEIPHEKLFPIIQNATLIILPSLIDNLPNTLLESMGMGKPVLGTYEASFDEIIKDSRNGFLVERNNPRALERKILAILKRKDLDKIGREAKKTIKNLRPELTVKELLDYFQKIIDKKGEKTNFK